MRLIPLLASFILLALSAQPFSAAERVLVDDDADTNQHLRIISFNIRYDADDRESGEKPWWDWFCFMSPRCRLPHVVDQISRAAADAPDGAEAIIGLQEALDNQVYDIREGLGSDWRSIGVGRDNGQNAGEFNPIFYRSGSLELLHSETKWLSTDTEKANKAWGASKPRIVTIGVFESITTGQRLIHANTHLDHVSSESRTEGVKVVLSRVHALADEWGTGDASPGIIITGDFNSKPDADAYKTLTDDGYTEDLFQMAEPSQRQGKHALTYTGFTPNGAEASILDFIFLGPVDEELFEVESYELLNNFEGGVYISDHRAVVGDVKLLS